ncbi:MAG: hypothetical protein ACUVXA_07665 [Candidatus Jordarchaeum sp.]|uniref:hypothetical protein n=1 Tax=Candidatus Jordarchaeum sp. TaxID=2823881 RepID=UPI004049954C
MTEPNMNQLIELVEVNLGSWKPEAVAIVDVNHKVWCKKGNVLGEFLDYYRKFPLSDMHLGDSLHNSNTFFMKVTDKTGIIVVMKDPQVARLAAINLRGRLNALSDFYLLEKLVEEDKKSKLSNILKKEKGIW